jgi:hypothetical protein
MLFFVFHSPGFTETYMKVVPLTGTAVNGAVNGNNVLSSNNSYGALQQDGSITPANEWTHAIEASDFGLNFEEEDYGYISRIEVGMEYVLSPAALGAGEDIEVMVRADGTDIGEGSWLRGWNSPAPDDTVTGTDTIWTGLPSASVQDFYCSWARVNGDAADSVGFDVRPIWTPGGGSTATEVRIDHIYLRALTKLVVYGDPLSSGATITEGATNVPLLHLILKGYSNTGLIVTGLRVDLEGTGLAASDLSAVRLYADADSDGVVDVGEELLDTVIPSGLTVNFSGATLIDSPPHGSKYIVAVDIKSSLAGLPKYVGARVVDHTYITLSGSVDEVLADGATGRTAPYVVDTINPNPLFPVRTGDTDPARVKIIDRAEVSTSWISPGGPISVDEGAAFDVTVRVTNAVGGGTAENVNVNLPFLKNVSFGSPAVMVSNIPNAVTLTPGSSYDFDLNFIATEPGIFQFYANSDYTDSVSGVEYTTSNSGYSGIITINDVVAPELHIKSLSFSPTVVSMDQTIVLTVEVENLGEVDAVDVGLYHPDTNALWNFKKVSGGGNATLNAGAWAQKTISVGLSETWTFNFTPTVVDDLSLSFYAKDAIIGNKIPVTTSLVTIQSPAALTRISAGATPTPIGKNSSFNISVKVTNTGGTTINNVEATMPSIVASLGTPNPLPEYRLYPTPRYVTLKSGESNTFVWVFDSNCLLDIGSVNIGNLGATGIDANSGLVKTTGVAGTIPNFTINNSIVPQLVSSASAAVDTPVAYSYYSDYYCTDANSRLYAFNQTGTEKWFVDFAALGQVISNEMVSVTYDVQWNPIILVGMASGRVYAVQDFGTSAGGFPLWNSSLSSSFIALDDSPVSGVLQMGVGLYINAGQTVYRYDFEKRTKKWSWNLPGVTINGFPSMDNSFVYVGCSDGTIRSIASGSGVYTSSSGDTGGSVKSPFAYEGKLYASNSIGKVMKIDNPTGALSTAPFINLSTTDLSDIWVTINSRFAYVTDGAGTTLYQLGITAAGAPTLLFSKDLITEALVDYASAPLSFGGKIYVGAADSANNDGKVFVFKETSGVRYLNIWPYVNDGVTPSGYYSAAALDIANNTFLLGCEDGKAYMFSIPEGNEDIWTDLIALWRLDEGVGTIAYDLGGDHHDGTITGGPIWQTGSYDGGAGYHLEFDGVDDLITEPNGGDYLNGLEAITFCLWVKSDVTNQDRGIFFCRDPNSSDDYLGIRYDKDGWAGGGTSLIKFSLRTTTGNTQVETASFTQTTDWQHLAIVWDSNGDGRIHLYINGIETIYTSDFGPVFGTIEGCTKILFGVGTKNKKWDGRMDDIRVFKRALSLEEILNLAHLN